MSEDENPQTAGGVGDLLNTDRQVPDIKLVSRAVRHGWNVPPEAREQLGPILLKIAQKDTTTTTDSEGNAIEISNARNQIAAAKCLAELDKVNQTDFWNQDKNDRLDAGKLTENNGFMPAIIEQPIKSTG